MIVSDVGLDPKVTALSTSLRGTDAGEDYTGAAKNYPTPPGTAGMSFSEIGASVGEVFCTTSRHLPPQEARVLTRVSSVQKVADDRKDDEFRLRTKRRSYAVSSQDRTINPDLEPSCQADGREGIELIASHFGGADLTTRCDHEPDVEASP